MCFLSWDLNLGNSDLLYQIHLFLWNSVLEIAVFLQWWLSAGRMSWLNDQGKKIFWEVFYKQNALLDIQETAKNNVTQRIYQFGEEKNSLFIFALLQKVICMQLKWKVENIIHCSCRNRLSCLFEDVQGDGKRISCFDSDSFVLL